MITESRLCALHAEMGKREFGTSADGKQGRRHPRTAEDCTIIPADILV